MGGQALAPTAQRFLITLHTFSWFSEPAGFLSNYPTYFLVFQAPWLCQAPPVTNHFLKFRVLHLIQTNAFPRLDSIPLCYHFGSYRACSKVLWCHMVSRARILISCCTILVSTLHASRKGIFPALSSQVIPLPSWLYPREIFPAHLGIGQRSGSFGRKTWQSPGCL